MQFKFDKKSCFLKFIVFAITQKLFLADTVTCAKQNAEADGNCFDVKSNQEFSNKVMKNEDVIIVQYHTPLVGSNYE